MAASVSFVAFQGWQLLFYDQGRIADPDETIPRAVYASIPAAVVGVELLYFERERLPDPLLDVGAEVEDDVTALADEGLDPGALSGDESDGGDG